MPLPTRTLPALIAAALIAALVVAGNPARAEDPSAPLPAPSATPKPVSNADRIIGPLREIGRVRARSPYCSALVRSGTPAAESTIAFELARVTLASDLHDAQFTDTIHKSYSMRLLEFDLAHMVELIKQGRAELNELRALARDADDEKAAALLGLRDALDGAKARQMEQLRSFARVVGTFEEHPVTIPGTPADDKDRDETTPTSRLLDPFEDVFTDRYDAAETLELLRAGEQDDLIKDDMIHAGDSVTHALALGNCETE
jgi:hypothetical protein